MIKASELRNKEILKTVPSLPGYYKWWAEKKELIFILERLNIQFTNIEKTLEQKEDLFCIYVGIANKSIRFRLDWHVNDSHTITRVNNGTLSTLRQTLSSLVVGNQFNKKATDSFIDNLYVEWFYNINLVKTEDAKNKLHKIEKNLMTEYLRILNIQDNHHPLSQSIKIELKRLRKESKNYKKA